MSYDISVYYRDTEIELWSRNMTSNVAKMWRAASCDLAEFAGKTTDDLRPPLAAAIAAMEEDPDRFRDMNPPNGWGSYEGCLDYLRDLLAACDTFQGELIGVCR